MFGLGVLVSGEVRGADFDRLAEIAIVPDLSSDSGGGEEEEEKA
jgi:hypothetical protein